MFPVGSIDFPFLFLFLRKKYFKENMDFGECGYDLIGLCYGIKLKVVSSIKFI